MQPHHPPSAYPPSRASCTPPSGKYNGFEHLQVWVISFMRKQHIPLWTVSKLQDFLPYQSKCETPALPRTAIDTPFQSSLETFLPEGPHPHSGLGNGSPSMKHCWALLVFSTSGARHVSSVQAVWVAKPVQTAHCPQRYLIFLKVSWPLRTVCFHFVILNPQAVHCKCMQLTTPGSTRKQGRFIFKVLCWWQGRHVTSHSHKRCHWVDQYLAYCAFIYLFIFGIIQSLSRV